jgi:hypothetical protein
MRSEPICAARIHGYVTAWFARGEYNHVNLPPECTTLLTNALHAQLTPGDLDQHMAAGARLSEAAAIAEALRIATSPGD